MMVVMMTAVVLGASSTHQANKCSHSPSHWIPIIFLQYNHPDFKDEEIKLIRDKSCVQDDTVIEAQPGSNPKTVRPQRLFGFFLFFGNLVPQSSGAPHRNRHVANPLTPEASVDVMGAWSAFRERTAHSTTHLQSLGALLAVMVLQPLVLKKIHLARSDLQSVRDRNQWICT